MKVEDGSECPRESEPHGPTLGRQVVRLLPVLTFWTVLFMMVAPASAFTVPATPVGVSAPAPHASTAPTYVAPGAHAATSTPTAQPVPTLAGSNPRLGMAVDGPAIAAQTIGQMESVGANPVGAAPGAALPPPLPTTAARLAHSGDPTPMAPAPLANNIVTGSVTGFVYQTGTGTALQGVSVTVYSVGGAVCPQTNCTTVTSTLNGSFGFAQKLQAPVGADYIELTLSGNLTNDSYITVYPHQTSYAGIIYLTPDALGWGYVYTNTSTPKPIRGIQACGSSRDSVIQSAPCGASQTNGSYIVSYPPLPSVISYTSLLCYKSDFRFANGTPHYAGQPLTYLGIVYMTPCVNVRAELYDAAKSTPTQPVTVSSGFCTPTCHAMTICATVGNVCFTQGTSVGGSTVEAQGFPGPSYVEIFATGYIVNTVYVGNLTAPSSGTYIDVGKIFLVPMGDIYGKVGLTANRSGYGNMWPTSGEVYASVCSMDGYQDGIPIPSALFFGGVNMTETGCETTCFPNLGANTYLVAYPGRDDVKTTPDYTPTCNPFFGPTWPIPNFFPVWGNETWANVTPDAATNVGWINLTAGTYVYGTVHVQGQTYAPRNYTVTAASISQPGSFTQYPFRWEYVYQNYGGGWKEENNGWACNGVSQTNATFCVPAPPGDFQIQVTSTDNLPMNFTWGFSHNMCCAGISQRTGISLSAVTLDQEQIINVTGQGRVTGMVLREGSNLGVSFGSVAICPAGSATVPGIGCADAVVLPSGAYTSWAPVGWDYITGAAAGFNSNTVWVYITANATTNAGNMTLVPKATIDGFVVDPYGSAIPGATVVTCLLASYSACTPLGLGQTNTQGYYNGSLAGGWLPWATYMVKASAPGYSTDWTFINATSGVATRAHTLVLFATGADQGIPQPVPKASNLIWIYGRVVDNSTSVGVQGAAVSVCTVSTLVCTSFIWATNGLGEFNESIADGIYYLDVTAPGYIPGRILVTALTGTTYNAGTLHIQAFALVTGRVALSPWNTDGTGNISVPYCAGPPCTISTSTTWHRMALGPVASVSVCTSNRTICAPSAIVSSQGTYTAQAPQGLYLYLAMGPTGAAVGPSVQGGVTANSTVYNSTGWQTNISTTLNADVFASVYGNVRDASTFNTSLGVDWLPVQFSAVGIITDPSAPTHSTVNYNANGGGWIDFFVPPGPTQSFFFAPPSYMYNAGTKLVNATLVAGGSDSLGNLSLGHFGWANFHVVNSVTNRPAPYIGVTAYYPDTTNNTYYSVPSLVNGAGLVNITSYAAKKVQVSLGGSQDFNNTTFHAWVNASVTIVPPTTVIPGQPGIISLDPWGWVKSAEVNNSTGAQVFTVVDFAKQLPLPGVQVAVSSTDPQYGQGSSQPSSWYGQFLSDSPVGKYNVVTTTRYGYLTNTSHMAISPGEVATYRSINVTGDGVVAGRVVGLPSYNPIEGAQIQLCAPKAACFTAITNSSGVFWVLADPGTDTVTATATGYVTNSSAPARTCSDCWTWMGTIELSQFAYAMGVVRGLPSGLPIRAANVSLCSPLGNPVGACGFSNNTGPDGSFVVEAPAGTYVLAANASGYNTTYRPVALSAGQHAQVGTLYLQKFGQVIGTVYSAQTLTAISGATVLACARWGGGSCVPPVLTDSAGTFAVAGPPGPYLLTVSAPGFADGYQATSMATGALTSTLPILLTPLGVDQSFPVTGSVVNASNPSQGIGGATVTLSVGPAPAFSTSATASGAFSLMAVYGNYTLTVSAAGYRPASRPLLLTGPVSDLQLALGVMTFNVSGIVTDGLTLQPLANVALTEEGTILALTGADGSYSVGLANGTHTVTATYEGSNGVPYSAVTFTLVVNGVGLVHNLGLVPATSLVKGFVVDSLTGLPLPNAVVSVQGLASDGVPMPAQSIPTDASGGFSVNLPAGSYSATTSYLGYSGVTVKFAVTTTPAPVTLALAPAGAATSVSSGSTPLLPLLAALGAVVVGLGLVGLYVLWRRRPADRPGSPVGRRPAGTAPGGSR